MDDMQAIEQRIAGEMLRRAGPSEPVDDLAVFDAVIAATRSQIWGFTMFSALKFVAASVIVALFGGFLIAGILTTPADDRTAPAAVTASPSPMTTDELLAGMVTEEVEPGVLRVINDGVRDLSSRDIGFRSQWVDITPDGDVWLSSQLSMYRLGDETTIPVPDDFGWPYLDVGPDGSLWAIAPEYIQSFDGEMWTERSERTGDDLLLGSLAIGPDGTVWVAASDRDKYCPQNLADCFGTDLMRLEDDGSLTTIDDWADVYEGDVAYDELAVSPDGDVWLIGMVRWDGPEAEALLRFDGDAWEVIPGPEGFLNHLLGNSLDIGPDGTLWVHTRDPEGDDWNGAGLARFDDPGWTAFTEVDGVQDWGGESLPATDLLEVAPDGSLWMNGARDGDACGGLAHYDGTTWTSYLGDSCIHDLAIAPDGSVWVRATRYGMDRVALGGVNTYVIRPEAGATTE